MEIWKAPLAIREHQLIAMPDGAKILTIQMQNGSPTVWFACEPSHLQRVRRIAMLGTGHSRAALPGEYIATVQDGSLVWHFFDCGY